MRVRTLSRSVGRIAAVAAFGVGAVLGGLAAAADGSGSPDSEGGSYTATSSDTSDERDEARWD
jgi:anti-sigma factor RsiW